MQVFSIHQQNVEVKYAEGKKRRRTKRRNKKRRMGQNVEWKKRRLGQKKKTSTMVRKCKREKNVLFIYLRFGIYLF
jgi:hypothetical protein